MTSEMISRAWLLLVIRNTWGTARLEKASKGLMNTQTEKNPNPCQPLVSRSRIDLCQFCEYIHKFTDLFNLKASKSILKAGYSLLFLQHVRGKAHCLHLIGTFKVLVTNGDIPRRKWLKRSPNIILLASSWVSAALWSLCIFLGHATPRACGSRTFWLSGAQYIWLNRLHRKLQT